jgi:hypothetical protein
MKKYIITSVLTVSLIAPLSTFAIGQPSTTVIPPASPTQTPVSMPAITTPVASTTIATSSPFQGPAQPAPRAICIQMTRTLTLGSRDFREDGEVTALQNFLRGTGHFKVGSTGYFGPVTLQAVKAYQKENNIPNTGLVGPMTRAHVNPKMCMKPLPPVPTPVATSTATSTNSLTVVAPQGGEVWPRFSTQTIQWTDSNTYIQEPKYDIKVQLDLDCKPGQACIALYPVPMTIAKNVSRTEAGFQWRVGDKLPANTFEAPMVPDGKYRVLVCPAGNANIEDINGCAKSASYITIQTGVTTTY